MDLGLKDKVAVITGGSNGIGLAIAEGLAREGVRLAMCARDEKRLSDAAGAIREKHGVETYGMKVDVSVKNAVQMFVDGVKSKFGGADILVNNAGMGSEEKIMTAPDERWQYYWDLHVMAAVRLSRGLAPLMKARGGGVILHNASICARQPADYEPIYNVTKAALAMFSKCLANELIADNIRVNCINLGYVLTPDWKKTATSLGAKEGISWEEYIGRIARQNAPIGRFASVEEAANFFVFLSSPRASYCVGSTVYVDGGLSRCLV
jgi:NAD(P)-dependent dehydrogenase (short-subunit alcohol dehydrogenase family)